MPDKFEQLKTVENNIEYDVFPHTKAELVDYNGKPITEMLKPVMESVEGNYLSLTDTYDSYMQNVEIKGNTTQDPNNLADIRSCGDKLENQELYEIPLLCTGKNINSSKFELGGINSEGGLVATTQFCRTIDYVPVMPNTNIIASLINSKYSINRYLLYDIDKKLISTSVGTNLTTTTNTRFIKWVVYDVSSTININEVNNCIQFEYATLTTPYEPYQEHKLTILSPTQLEKVGDVADRIVEKDGVWGVEKNVGTGTIDKLPVGVYMVGMEKTIRFNVEKANVFPNAMDISPASKRGLSNQLPISHIWSIDEEGFYIDSMVVFRFNKDRFLSLNINEYNNYLSKTPLIFKYATTTPTFIPLPQAQQVKLRTFANKTNISFLCETEGTIKADVPKSLGATVNTHTTQIDSLSKDLERVKKLEEATTSTVEFDGNFATVEETSNGYFEDVELKGRTLVNLSSTGKLISSVTEKPCYGDVNESLLIKDKSYTLVMINTPTAIDKIYLGNGANNNIIKLQKYVSDTVIFKYEENAISSVCRLYLYRDTNFTQQELDDFRFIILEGDHTQNPPSYFEGLKSVGEGTDEIVVSSVNENLFDKLDTLIRLDKSNTDYCLTSINTINTTRICFNLYDENLNELTGNYVNNGGISGFYYNDSTNCYVTNISQSILNEKFKLNNVSYIKFIIGKMGTGEYSNVMFNKGTTPKPYTPHKTDKKQLLFLDDADNTWKKPILDEFSTVKKGSDGKYRYYKRGDKVVLNGSENLSGYSGATGEHLLGFQISLLGAKGSECISSTLKSQDGRYVSTLIEEGVYLRGDLNRVYIKINKSKLTTPDVEGFKKWLQANNVTVVYQLAQEKVYECTPLDLICYEGETNVSIESGVLSPRTTLRVQNYISNVVNKNSKTISGHTDELLKHSYDIDMLYKALDLGNEGVYGVTWDVANNQINRIKTGLLQDDNIDFNKIYPWSEMKRCTVNDKLQITSYYGQDTFVEDGSIGQVMVRIPRFWYKTTPLALSNCPHGDGLQTEKVTYEISGIPLGDFKLHPCFIRDGVELNEIFVSAYEGSIFDVSANKYLKADEQVADFVTDKLCSIINAKPCSGLTQNLHIENTRKLANNRGEGWHQLDFLTASAIQMLFLVEYASFDTQTIIGKGVTELTDVSDANCSINTGGTSKLGNASGMADGVNGKVSVSYRGIENFWGNIWTFVDGVSIEAKGIHNAYYKDSNYVNNTNTDYNKVNFTLSKENGYISKIGYDKNNDFTFLPSESKGASNKSLCDYFYQNNAYNGYLIMLIGAGWNDGLRAGGFCWYAHDAASIRGRAVGCRSLCYKK